MQESLVRKRDDMISTIKGIGIILIVVGHSGCPEWLRNFIYMFHVPLFFITAGYFYKGCDNFSNLTTFVIKRLKGLYVPFVKWSLAFLLLHNLFGYLNFYSDDIGYYGYNKLLHDGIFIILTMGCNGQLLGAFWFLKTLFLASCGVAIIDFLTRGIKEWNNGAKKIVILAFFIVLGILSKTYSIQLPVINDLSWVCLGASFFVIGSLIKQYKVSLRIYQSLALLVIVFLISMIVPYEMITVPPTLILVYFICATISFVAISNLIERYRMNNSKFVYLGEHTLIILALHFLCFKLVSLLKIYLYGLPLEDLSQFPVIFEYNSYFWILYSIIGIFIPLLLENIYNNIKPKRL